MPDFQKYVSNGTVLESISYFRLTRNKLIWRGNMTKNVFHRLILVKEGKFLLSDLTDAVEKKFTVLKGQLIVIPCDTPYICEYAEDGTVICGFLFKASENLPEILKLTDVYDSEHIRSVFNSINEENCMNDLFLKAKLFETLYAVENKRSRGSSDYNKILPAIMELKSKYYENRRIEYYAKLCHMSETHFRRLFKKELGRSLVEYRNEMRLEIANRMVEEHECGITEAGFRVGFSTSSHYFDLRKKR